MEALAIKNPRMCIRQRSSNMLTRAGETVGSSPVEFDPFSPEMIQDKWTYFSPYFVSVVGEAVGRLNLGLFPFT